jgi:hypothetical protein
MKPTDDSKRFLNGKQRSRRDLEREPEEKKQKSTEPFQESMQEDKRGPMEGMEAVPSKK